MPIKRALVPVDGSGVSMRAVKLAAWFAKKLDWEVVVLHVFEPPPMPSFTFPDVVKEGTLQDLKKEAHKILRQAEKALQSEGVEVNTKLIEGSTPEMILAEVEEGCCEIIIMGSTGLGRGKLSSLVLGSVAESVVRSAKVPVLLMKEDTVLDL